MNSEIEIPEGWTRWPGGECPEDAMGEAVDLIFRDGKMDCSGSSPDDWFWDHVGREYDIIAYRVRKPAQPEPTDGQFSAADMSDARAAGYRDGIAAVRPAAMAVVKRWQSPDWAREREHTSELIERLRVAVGGEDAASSQPPDAGDVEALALEGLAYFDKAGDDGDRKYVAAIREHIRRLTHSPAAGEVEALSDWQDHVYAIAVQVTGDQATAREIARRLTPPRSDAPETSPFANPSSSQPPKPAGNAIDGLLATARPFLAEELLLKQGYTWSGSGWVAPAAKHEGETRDEKIARVRTGLREHAKRFRDPIELAQEIHGTAQRETVGNVESLASALATAHTQWGAKSSETRGSLYAHMAKAIFDRIGRANSREAAALARLVPVGKVEGYDSWGPLVEWNLRGIPSGTQLYTLTPSTGTGTEESGDA